MRSSSSGTSYDWKEGREGGGVALRSNGFGVARREDGAGVDEGGVMTAPTGISPSLSTTNDGGVDRTDALLLSPGRRGSSASSSVSLMCVETDVHLLVVVGDRPVGRRVLNRYPLREAFEIDRP